MKNVKNILVIRNDKLGDFMLAWPALSLLKQQYPDVTITALVPSYTKPMAEICPWIDDCIIDEQHKSVFSDAIFLKNKIIHSHQNYPMSVGPSCPENELFM